MIVFLVQTCVWGGEPGFPGSTGTAAGAVGCGFKSGHLLHPSGFGCCDLWMQSSDFAVPPPHELATTLAHIAAHLDVEIIVGVEVLVPRSLFPASILISGH